MTEQSRKPEKVLAQTKDGKSILVAIQVRSISGWLEFNLEFRNQSLCGPVMYEYGFKLDDSAKAFVSGYNTAARITGLPMMEVCK